MRSSTPFAVALALAATTVTAGDYAEYRLEGVALVAGPSLVDLDQQGTNDTHMHMIFRGEAAKALYDGLRIPAQEDACTGGQIKRAETGITCLSFEDGLHECFFGLDMRDATLTHAGVVC